MNATQVCELALHQILFQKSVVSLPSIGTCTDTHPAGDHKYTLVFAVHMASRDWRGSHWKSWIAHSCSKTTKSFIFWMSQIQRALGMLSIKKPTVSTFKAIQHTGHLLNKTEIVSIWVSLPHKAERPKLATSSEKSTLWPFECSSSRQV